MRIGEFAQISGVPVDTLRYYDKLGLLTPAKSHRQRIYTEEDLGTVQRILKLKRLNFNLAEIQSILRLDETLDQEFAKGVRNPELAGEGLALLRARYEEILRQESELREVKGQLEHLMRKIEAFIKGG